jgi:hypothetical protein
MKPVERIADEVFDNERFPLVSLMKIRAPTFDMVTRSPSTIETTFFIVRIHISGNGMLSVAVDREGKLYQFKLLLFILQTYSFLLTRSAARIENYVNGSMKCLLKISACSPDVDTESDSATITSSRRQICWHNFRC